MEDRELYQHLLGLTSPWTVSQVTLDTEAEEMVVRVEHPRGEKLCCSKCGKLLPIHDHAQSRRWRHLDSCQFKTILETSVPRVKCPEHGAKNSPVPWDEKHSRFTIDFTSCNWRQRLATEACDKARRTENKRLQAAGDDRLKGTRYLWLKSHENLTDKQYARFDTANQAQLSAGKASAYKEMLRGLWNHPTAQEATSYFKGWYQRVIHTELTLMKEVAKTIKRRVGGYRNTNNFDSTLFFYRGELDLHPR